MDVYNEYDPIYGWLWVFEWTGATIEEVVFWPLMT